VNAALKKFEYLNLQKARLNVFELVRENMPVRGLGVDRHVHKCYSFPLSNVSDWERVSRKWHFYSSFTFNFHILPGIIHEHILLHPSHTPPVATASITGILIFDCLYFRYARRFMGDAETLSHGVKSQKGR
jgi:hypothetical protein